jgi:hypothetical protein
VGIILQLGQATTGEVGVWHMCNGNDDVIGEGRVRVLQTRTREVRVVQA